MRFFIGAIVSTLILSPSSVLSMALDSTPSNAVAEVKGESSQFQVAGVDGLTTASSSSSSSPLDKRFCVGRCSKKNKPGYQCKKKHISKNKVRKAKIAACKMIKENKQKGPFPSAFTAYSFSKNGPYLEWPVKRNGHFWNKFRHGRYRVIMTRKCEVVGVVVRHRSGAYSKCTDLDKLE